MKRENNPIRLPSEAWCSFSLPQCIQQKHQQHPTKEKETLDARMLMQSAVPLDWLRGDLMKG